MEDQFIRTRMLLGANAMERLGKSHVAVLGLGGVGSWCAEALARSGAPRPCAAPAWGSSPWWTRTRYR